MKNLNTVNSLLKKGIESQQKGQLDFAESLYKKALHLDPKNADTLDLLGITSMQKGNLPEAFDYVNRAIRIARENPFFLNDIAEITMKQGKLKDAIAYFEKSLALKPDYTDVHLKLAAVHNETGDRVKAIEHLKHFLEKNPDHVVAHKMLGFTYFAAGQHEQAIIHNKRAISLSPDDLQPWYNLGVVYQLTGNWDEAIECYTKVIALNPSANMAYNNLGTIFYDKRNYGKARKYYLKTIELEPGNDLCYMNLAKVCQEQGKAEEARTYYEKSNSLRKKDSVDIVLALMLPPIYESREQVAERKTKLLHDLKALEGRTLHVPDPLREIGTTNFYSAYHEYDEKEVQTKLYNILRPVVAPENKPIKKRARGEKINIGFISRHFKDHTIGKLNRGIMAGLSRKDFSVTTLSIGRHNDPVSNLIKENSDRFLVVPYNLRQGQDMIRDLNLDILFYTDIGMEPLTYFLAFSRLAPVQCVTWGHPVTTGMDTMDYFISSKLIEPENGEAHYTEKLIQLKTFNVYYHKPSVPDVLKNRADFSLPEVANLYLCPQTLMKMHPDFDSFISGILRKDPCGRFVIIKSEHENWNETLTRRFEKEMPDVSERVFFMDRVPYDDFISLVALSDVVLDPIYFGGGNTSYETFATGVPIVTLPGQYMRSRLTLGQYSLMDIMDCVAKDKEEYIDLAVRLGTDKDFNNTMKSKILKSNHLLYEDQNCITELEDFFKTVVNDG